MASATYTVVNDDEALVGSIVAERYLVRDVIGRGGTGTVFGTEHLSFGRHAAMKVLRPRFTSLETARHVFQTETLGALAIGHPSLCEVYDLGTLPDGAPFFVMERLEGETLQTRLARERFSAAAAVDVMMQLLAAIDAVHERRHLLRDLRPQNVFLAHRRGCRPVVKVLDVGLARLMPLERVQPEWDAIRSATTVPPHAPGLMSVPHYVSPERARSEHGLDVTSDLFAAGVILYEVLCGQRPFIARTWAALAQQIATTAPLPVESLRSDLPPALGELVARALSPDPRERPASARVFQDELRAVFEGPRRPVSSPTGSTASPAAPHEPTHEPAHERPHDDETRTDRRIADLTVVAASPLAQTTLDLELEEQPAATARGSELDATLDVAWPGGSAPRRDAPTLPSEDEETATMQLNPEIRARIEQLTKRAVPTPPPPPPVHPIRPPRQR